MNLNKFTNKAQEAAYAAQTIAQNYNHTEIEPLHILLALMQQTDGIVPQVVAKIGTRPQSLVADIEGTLQSRPKVHGSNVQTHATRAAMDVLTRAETEANRMKDDYVSTEHILLALTQDKLAGDILRRNGIDYDSVLKALTVIRGGQRVSSQDPEATYQTLEKYRARRGDPPRHSGIEPPHQEQPRADR
jgi:ATP-dependent Clp protease ATP-binding subunit ClpB